ncbi:MAG: hypothetical protein ACYTEI_14865, partial [Planctomycetota bacterium]
IRLWKWAVPDLTRHVADRCRGPDGRPTEYWYPQPSAGLDLVRARWRIFLAQLYGAGAPLDEVILDFEKGYDMWGGMADEDKAAHLAAIQNDPRFHGVQSSEAEDLDRLDRVHDFRRHGDYLVWNAAMRRVVDAALEASIYEPLRELYPNARCSNYDSYYMRRDLAAPDARGGYQWSESEGFGTHDAIEAYGHLRQVTSMPLRDGRPLGGSPYAGLLYTIKRVEAVSNSSSRPLKVWVSPRDRVNPKWPSALTGTPYHDELLRHLIVRRHGLLFWNAYVGGDDQQMLHTNAILARCAARIGEAGPGLEHATSWSAGIIQSTTYNGDVVVHRFTLEHPQVGLRYRVNDVEWERFPKADEVGLWVTHARGDEFHVVE